MLEREVELEQLSNMITRAREGVGGLAVVEGPAGIGKTSLLDAAHEVACDQGLATLSARGGPLERDFAFGIVRQLLGPRSIAAAAPVEGLASEALRALGLLGSGGPSSARIDPGSAEGVAAVVQGVYWAIAALAEQRPLTVVIDDAQWADPPSWRLVAYLARHIDDLAIVVMLGTRPELGDDGESSLAELESMPLAEVIRPRPLSGRASGELVRDRLGPSAHEAFCEACHRASAGNPFLLEELIGNVQQTGIEPTRQNAAHIAALRPGSVARSVLANLARLGPDAGELARAIAIFGSGAELRWARLLTELDSERAAAATDALIAAGLLLYRDTVGFVHPLVRATVYDSIPAARKALLHLRAAKILDSEGADPDRIAAQLLLAEPAGDPAVVATLRAAADLAGRRGAPEAAVRYLARALREPAAGSDDGVLRRALGRARIRAGDTHGIDDLVAAREASADAVERGEIALELGRGMMMVDRSTDALDLFAEARQELGSDQAALNALLEAEEVGGALLDISTAARATAVLRSSEKLAGETLGERLLLAYRSYVGAARGSAPAEAAADAHRALAEGDLDTEQTIAAFCFAASALTFVDRYDEALAALDAAISGARERGSTLTFALASWWRSHVHYRRGELADAEADAQGALDATSEEWFTAPVGFLADAMVERGRVEAADAAFRDYGLTDVLFPNLLVANLLLDARGRLRCAQGHYEQGLGDLLAVGERQAAWEISNPSVIPWRSSAALACSALGDGERAGVLVEEELALARTPRARGMALRAAGLVREGRDGVELLHESVATLETSGARLEYARAVTDLGAALRRSGRRTEAREPLRVGLDVATECGASAIAARAREELVTAGARPRRARIAGAEALTASERRIATMAATGMTNREIAQALFITIKTVKAHLGHVFQKLDITTRAQLAAALTEQRPEAARAGAQGAEAK